METVPKNILILVTHGSYYIPSYLKILLSSQFKKNNYRLLKNYSDFGTSKLLSEKIPKNQIIICNFSRALGDPNRERNSKESFRKYDFNSVKIWKIDFPALLKNYLTKKYYDKYHKQIEKKISLIEKKYEKILILDIHDTRNYLLSPNKKGDTKRKENFPEINLGNYGNKSSSKATLNHLAKIFEKEFKIKPSLNKPHKGGYVTQKYGINKPKREVIQIEFGRYQYLSGKKQKTKNNINDFKEKLLKVISQIKQPKI